MRINGRILRPSTLAERRVLFSLGVSFLKVPRRFNPFQIARIVRRVALGVPADLKLLQSVARRPLVPTMPTPDRDTSLPVSDDDVVAA